MISLTRLDGKDLVVNADHILTIEPTPDTVLHLTTGLRLMVRESVEDVLERVVAYRRRLQGGPDVRRAVVPFPRGVPDPPQAE
jgi:flagellar protein FlbD